MFRSPKFNIITLGAQAITHLKTATVKLDAKTKGTFVERFINYIKLVGRDYKDVAIQTKQDIKDRPLKSTLLFTGIGIAAVTAITNPNLQSYHIKFIECKNGLSTVNLKTANPIAVEHLKHIQKCYNANLLRHTSLGIFSIIWEDKYSDECGHYETNCSYLGLPYSELPNRILDIGFLNIWWIMSRKMLDYDINY